MFGSGSHLVVRRGNVGLDDPRDRAMDAVPMVEGLSGNQPLWRAGSSMVTVVPILGVDSSHKQPPLISA